MVGVYKKRPHKFAWFSERDQQLVTMEPNTTIPIITIVFANFVTNMIMIINILTTSSTFYQLRKEIL